MNNSGFEADEFVLLQALKKQSDSFIERFHFVSKCFLHAFGDLFHSAYAIATFPELAADLVEVNFVVRMLEMGKKMFSKNEKPEFWFEQTNQIFFSLFPLYVLYWNQLQ